MTSLTARDSRHRVDPICNLAGPVAAFRQRRRAGSTTLPMLSGAVVILALSLNYAFGSAVITPYYRYAHTEATARVSDGSDDSFAYTPFTSNISVSDPAAPGIPAVDADVHMTGVGTDQLLAASFHGSSARGVLTGGTGAGATSRAREEWRFSVSQATTFSLSFNLSETSTEPSQGFGWFYFRPDTGPFGSPGSIGGIDTGSVNHYLTGSNFDIGHSYQGTLSAGTYAIYMFAWSQPGNQYPYNGNYSGSFSLAIPGPTWVATSSGFWSAPANWGGGIPNGAGASATFGTGITVPATVTLDVPQVVGSVTFNNTNRYTLAGPGPLTLDVASGSANVGVISGNHTIETPLALADDTTFDIAAASSVYVPNLQTTTHAIMKTGAGKATFTKLHASSLDVQSGEVEFGGSYTGPWLVQSLAMSAGAKIDLNGGGDLVVDYTGATPYEQIRAMIADGRLTTDEVNTSVGIAELSTLPAGTSPEGDGTSVLVRAVLAGDANLDWHVDFDDLLALAQNYGLPTNARWIDGDFDYSGSVNFDDLLALAQNYGDGSAVVPRASAEFSADWALAQSLVPEPGMLMVAVVTAPLLTRRRRAGRVPSSEHCYA